jgi:carnitine O-acetyltransferase
MASTAGRPESARKRTFDNQSILPRLPIPTLKETSEKYLKSLEPLLSEKELATSKSAVETFVASKGLGPVLQKRLMTYDAKQEVSPYFDIDFTKRSILALQKIEFLVGGYLVEQGLS